MKQGSDLNRGAFGTLTLYAAMVAVTVVVFLWLSSLGTSLLVASVRAPEILGRSAPREHGADLFHVLLALLLVLVASRVLGSLFRYINQPPVIGEVVAGLMLGPSLLGHFAPGLASYVLPLAVAPYLGILAQIGVVLYMFLVGLEFDTKLLRSSAHASLAISHASIMVPFLLGTAAALWLYPRFAGSGVSFVVFAMFSGLSLSVTAFPVLARIVTDCGLQNNRLGTIALGCAAIDDVTAWCLLALMEGVARASTGAAFSTIGFTALYVCVIFGVIRPLVSRLCARQGERAQVSPTLVAVSLVALLSSALVTELIGIHALFGAFLLGVVVPHDSVLAKDLARRIKDLVVVLLLPAFFAFTGMRTKLSLIDGWEGWLICAGIVVIACVGKVGGSAIAARLSGLGWRDATSLGVLMNTRGLMELIVLNLGLELNIISPALFAMLVVMAVVTTFATSPLLRWLTGIPSLPRSERALAG